MVQICNSRMDSKIPHYKSIKTRHFKNKNNPSNPPQSQLPPKLKNTFCSIKTSVTLKIEKHFLFLWHETLEHN